jgi:hypothetical protein
MHEAPYHQPRAHPAGHEPPREQRDEDRSGLLSQSDPEPARSTRRPPLWLIVVVLLLAGIIVMHVAGVGPSH